jgi:ABC-type bacteriocin/lantibiotic exporter with double-glycine peptidase domain
MANFLSSIFSNSDDVKIVEKDSRFNFLLQTMMSNRWKITILVLFTFFFIIFGIVMAVMFKATIDQSWKEMLLILLGAFVGNLNKVIDFYFSSEDRDKMLIQKMDEEDGESLSSVLGEK